MLFEGSAATLGRWRARAWRARVDIKPAVESMERAHSALACACRFGCKVVPSTRGRLTVLGDCVHGGAGSSRPLMAYCLLHIPLSRHVEH